jgi:antitoxin component YwqK of YwqJK toxin-antitoxin module
MANSFRPKIILLVGLFVLLLLGAAGHLYYQTTRNMEDTFSSASFEQAFVPGWAYCDRGIEYLMEWERCPRCVATFHDGKGRLLNGRQEIVGEVREKKELDGKAEIRSSGPKRVTADFANGILEGPMKVFHENGRLAQECSYHDGLREGVCKNYAFFGWLMNEVEYWTGQETGTFRAYRPDGSLLSDGNAGSCQEYALGGGKKVSKKVSPDKAETLCCSPAAKETVNEGRLVKRQEYKSFQKGGALGSTATILEYSSGLGDNSMIYRETAVNGKLSRQETFLWDLHVVQDFDPSGTLRREFHYRHGRLDGTARWYDENGRLRREGTNTNMLSDGLFKWYNENGRVVWRAFYAKGTIFGEQTFDLLLGWVIFLAVQLVGFLTFFPVYVGLRKRIKARALGYVVAAAAVAALFFACAYFSFLIMATFYS